MGFCANLLQNDILDFYQLSPPLSRVRGRVQLQISDARGTLPVESKAALVQYE